jgi:predicted AlkP superfamily phosphohydrolase/phosphomutase
MLAIIQFDSASLPLLERLMAEGQLPALAELRRRGEWRQLEAPDAKLAAAVYHSLHSGTYVADHGLYHKFMWSAPEQRVRPMEAFPKPKTVWERLSDAGRRSLIIDPYISWPPRHMSGICVSGWQMRNRIVLAPWSVPRPVRRQLGRRLGRAKTVEEIHATPSAAHLLRLTERMIEAPDRAAAAAMDLLGRDEFDFFWVTLAPVHFGGHWLWDPLQLFDGELAPEERRRLADALPDIYRAVDRAVGRIIEALPPGADLIMQSPIGIGANVSRSDLLPGMLQAVLETGGSSPHTERGGGSALWRMRAAVPKQVRTGFSRAAPAAVNREIVSRMYVRGIDWRQTRAFAVPGETNGMVRLNIRGREREGIVEPEQADALMDEISEGLRSFRDPDGTPSVAAIERVQDGVSGTHKDRLPDLLVCWSDRPSAGLTSVNSPRFGAVVRDGSGTGWPGNHLDEAWAILVPGRHSRVSTSDRPNSVVDIAATACARLDTDATGLRGKTLLEAR